MSYGGWSDHSLEVANCSKGSDVCGSEAVQRANQHLPQRMGKQPTCMMKLGLVFPSCYA